jgi:polyribonucleotide nucleotidyltransferase
MVKVLAIEGNRIKLSRKALIREQKAKLAQSAPPAEGQELASGGGEFEAAPPAPAPARPRHEFDERQPRSNQSTILIEGGEDFDDDDEGGEEIDEENEPNFNRADGAPVPAGQVAGGGPRPAGGGGAGAGANRNRRRRRRGGRGPGGGSGGGGGR